MTYINADCIFPKRLGIMNGSTLVLEYYNLAKDKFKKHQIPFNASGDSKTIVEEIFKNSKHFVFLKKVDPKHVRAVIEGRDVSPKKAEVKILKHQEYDYGNFKQNEQRQPPRKAVYESVEVDRQEPRKMPNVVAFAVKEAKLEPQLKNIENVQDEYAEEFEEFQISQSMEKGNASISNKDKSHESSHNSNISKSSHSAKIEPPKSTKVKEQPIIQDLAEDNFEFIDEDAKGKKGKKEKKQKKEKKDKSKSKDKKGKKQKQTKQKHSTNEPAKQVQDEFQFL